MLGNEIYQGQIGCVLDGSRRNADLDDAVVHSGKLGPGGTRLYVDLKANAHLGSTHRSTPPSAVRVFLSGCPRFTGARLYVISY
jgi:hypothetical protein